MNIIPGYGNAFQILSDPTGDTLHYEAGMRRARVLPLQSSRLVLGGRHRLRGGLV